MNPVFESLTRPLVFFDLETTGVDPQTDRIVEFAAIRILPKSKGSWSDFTMLVNPGCPIPPAATEVHGITDADVEGCQTFAEAVDLIYGYIEGADLAGFNVRRFDVPLLQAELARCGKSLDFKSLRIIDSCDIFHKREPRTLEGALMFYCNEKHNDAHKALADVKATIRVFEGQLMRYEDLPTDVEKLHAEFFDADSVDLGGKLRWVGEEVCINFGKHKGAPLRQVPPGYLKWMREKGVIGADASEIIDRALLRQFPKRIVKEQ